MKCLECGHELEIMNVEDLECRSSDGYNFEYSRTEVIAHCNNCLRDWQWEEIWEFGDHTISKPRRKFWG